MLARQTMIDTIRGVYELYGFVPLSTPAIEYLDVLSRLAPDRRRSSRFSASQSPEDEPLGLRFDLTVPLARVDRPVPRSAPAVPPLPGVAGLARRQAGPGPLPRVHPVRPRLRRRRVRDRGHRDHRRHVRHARRARGRPLPRALLEPRAAQPAAALRRASRTSRGADVFRVLDKLEKIGLEKVRLELTTGYNDESGDTIPGVGLAADRSTASSGSSRSVGRPPRRRGPAPRAVPGVEAGGGRDRSGRTISSHLYSLGYRRRPVVARPLASPAASPTTRARSSRRSSSTRRSSARSSAAGATTIW